MKESSDIEKFDEFFKNSFEDFQPPAPSGSWSGIEGSLQKLKLLGYLGKVLLIVVPAAAIGGFMLMGPDKTVSQNAETAKPGTEILLEVPDNTQVIPEAGLQLNESDQQEIIAFDSNKEKNTGTKISSKSKAVASSKSNNESNLNSVQSELSGSAKTENSSTIPENPLVNNEKPKAQVLNFTCTDSVVCRGESISFKSSSNGFTNHRWEISQYPNINIPGESFRFKFNADGIFNVILRAEYEGNEYRSERKIQVRNIKAAFDYKCFTGGTVNFTNISSGASDYMWNFGDGSSLDNNAVPSHIFFGNSGTAYKVTLIASNPNGCVDTISRKILCITIPNVITPNNDQDNDKLEIAIAEEISYYELRILDRSGEMVFKTTDKNNMWNGTYMKDGKACPEGDYILILKYSIDGEKPVTHKGTVKIIR